MAVCTRLVVDHIQFHSMNLRRKPRDGVPPPSPETLGIIAAHLAMTFPVWVSRRKTTFSFVDDMTIRQHQSVDFQFPLADQFPHEAQPQRGQLIFVPISTGDKRSPLLNFDLYDADGRSLTLLNANDTAGLAARGMNAMVNGLIDERSVSGVEPDSQLDTLRKIASYSPDEAVRLADRELSAGTPLGRILAREDTYRSLVEELADSYLMLVPLAYDPGANMLVKWCYDGPSDWHSFSPRYPFKRLAVSLWSAIGVADKRHGFSGLSIGWAQSTHIAIEPPEGVNLGVARLDCQQWDSRSRRRVFIRGRRMVFGSHAVDLHVGPRCDFDKHDPDPDNRQRALENMLAARSDSARVVLRLRPSTATLIIPSVLASLATVAALWLAFFQLPRLDGQASAALLLLFPATVAAFLSRSGEHGYATRLLQGVRWSVATVAVCALAAVGVIAGGLVREQSDGRSHATVRCTGDSAMARPPAAAGVRRGTLDCVTRPARRDTPRISGTATTVVFAAAGVSSLFTAGPMLGMILTLWIGRARQRTRDSENLIPAA